MWIWHWAKNKQLRFGWFRMISRNASKSKLRWFRVIQINIYSFPCSHCVYHMISYVPHVTFTFFNRGLQVSGQNWCMWWSMAASISMRNTWGKASLMVLFDGWRREINGAMAMSCNVYDLRSISKYQPIDDQHTLCLCPANALQEEWTLQWSKARVGQTVCKQSYHVIPGNTWQTCISVWTTNQGLFDFCWVGLDMIFIYSKSSACASLDWLALGTLALLATLATSQFELTFFWVLRTAPGQMITHINRYSTVSHILEPPKELHTAEWLHKQENPLCLDTTSPTSQSSPAWPQLEVSWSVFKMAIKIIKCTMQRHWGADVIPRCPWTWENGAAGPVPHD